jgi:hypothetical protein
LFLQATTAAAPSILSYSWFEYILPLSVFADTDSSSGTNSSSTSVQGSKWFGSASRKKQAAAAAAAAASAHQSDASPTGFAYEAANMLLAVATWKLAKAGSLVMTQGGADSATAMEAYQLYCQAAGTVEELRRKLLPQLDASSSGGDLSRELVSALHLFALGEAQVSKCVAYTIIHLRCCNGSRAPARFVFGGTASLSSRTPTLARIPAQPAAVVLATCMV